MVRLFPVLASKEPVYWSGHQMHSRCRSKARVISEELLKQEGHPHPDLNWKSPHARGYGSASLV